MSVPRPFRLDSAPPRPRNDNGRAAGLVWTVIGLLILGSLGALFLAAGFR